MAKLDATSILRPQSSVSAHSLGLARTGAAAFTGITLALWYTSFYPQDLLYISHIGALGLFVYFTSTAALYFSKRGKDAPIIGLSLAPIALKAIETGKDAALPAGVAISAVSVAINSVQNAAGQGITAAQSIDMRNPTASVQSLRTAGNAAMGAAGAVNVAASAASVALDTLEEVAGRVGAEVDEALGTSSKDNDRFSVSPGVGTALWILFELAFSTTVTASVLYWSFAPVVLREATGISSYCDIAIHAILPIIALLDLAGSRIYFEPFHALYATLLSIVYSCAYIGLGFGANIWLYAPASPESWSEMRGEAVGESERWFIVSIFAVFLSIVVTQIIFTGATVRRRSSFIAE